MPKPHEELFEPERVCRILVQRGLLSPEQHRDLLSRLPRYRRKLEREREGRRGTRTADPGSDRAYDIIDILSSLNLERADDPSSTLEEEAIFQALAAHWGLPYKKIDPLKLDLNLVTTTVPYTFARKHMALPVGVEDGHLVVATPNPFNREVMEDISRVSQMRVRPVVSSRTDVLRLINEFFGFKRSIAAAETQFAGPSVDLGNLEQYVRLSSTEELPSNDQHIVNAVNHLLGYAFDQRASDVHIEPKRDASVIRMRIDGVLHTVYRLPKNVHQAMVSRIKNLSRMDMAEKRRPQDGRIKMDRGGVEAEIRVSSVPVAFGEKVVMRIMDPDILFQSLENLGLTHEDLMRYEQCIHNPHGIVLVTGPTGSGKSTTLYSTLQHLSSPEVNITTVEDPIEMIHEDFNQIAVQPATGITFGSILRNILRQDPDIIMIGEMRDLETAENAVQAALTGHLVLSTLHTNDAPSTLTRLLDLGVPPFFVQATLVGVAAQRLVRKICPHCKEPLEIEAEELRALGLRVETHGRVALQRGKGCIRCRGTGYLGRTGIFEIMPYTDAMKRMTRTETPLEDLREQARQDGMVTLRENALKKLLAGETTYQEVLRVTWERV
ncbi:MAG: type II/IV secretion system protein [Deltaproteobacteria bacterium]|nr:MAG: type II/IV secretion system protein [Deltaproteobacteria bacterium]